MALTTTPNRNPFEWDKQNVEKEIESKKYELPAKYTKSLLWKKIYLAHKELQKEEAKTANMSSSSTDTNQN